MNKMQSSFFPSAQNLYYYVLWCLCACEDGACAVLLWWLMVICCASGWGPLSGNLAAVTQAEWWSLTDNDAHLSAHAHSLALSLLGKCTSFTGTWWTVRQIVLSVLISLSLWFSITFTILTFKSSLSKGSCWWRRWDLHKNNYLP